VNNKEKNFKALDEFWPFYLQEHSNKTNRTLHFIGSCASLVWIITAIYKKKPSLLLGALINGYGLAWIGHFVFQKNKPATFKYPWQSFISDWRMVYSIITGKIDEELEKAKLDSIAD